MRLGARIPNSGEWVARLGFDVMGATLEAAGFESLWVGDHVVVCPAMESRYPYSSRDARLVLDDTWYDAVVAMGAVAHATVACEVGAGVIILPLRHPVVLAKQLATLDAISHGRIVLGAGAGWLREEFVAMNVEFSKRGRLLDEAIELLRRCWTGAPLPYESEFYHLPSGVLTRPAPNPAIPILVGGMSEPALRRVARLGDGWYAVQPADEIDPDGIARGRRRILELAGAALRLDPGFRTIVRLTGSQSSLAQVARALRGLGKAGVTDVVVDVDWERIEEVEMAYNTLVDSLT